MLRPKNVPALPCAGRDDIFFSKSPRLTAQAQAICGGCPIRESCGTEALRAEEGAGRHARSGVFGGLSPADRYALDRERIAREEQQLQDVAS